MDLFSLAIRRYLVWVERVLKIKLYNQIETMEQHVYEAENAGLSRNVKRRKTTGVRARDRENKGANAMLSTDS